MFRHPKINHSKGTSDDFNLEDKIGQSIRYFKVPANKDKSDVLNFLLNEIASSEYHLKPKSNVRQLYITYGSVAAAACVLLFVLYSFFGVQTYRCTNQTANVIFLPDQSRVVLAEGSELKISKLNYDREVKLKGEAYFEVEHGNKFYVKTRNGGVMVLGTRFRVNDSDNQLLVHCYEGTVGVDYSNENIKIDKGFGFEGLNSKVAVYEDSDYSYPKFASFNYDFQNKKLSEIWPVVEHFFGVKIEANFDSQKTFTGSFCTGDLEQVMEIICTPMQLKYKIRKNKKIQIELKEKI